MTAMQRLVCIRYTTLINGRFGSKSCAVDHSRTLQLMIIAEPAANEEEVERNDAASEESGSCRNKPKKCACSDIRSWT
jgi:hypothetical protein